jgi:hypothetical protein
MHLLRPPPRCVRSRRWRAQCWRQWAADGPRPRPTAMAHRAAIINGDPNRAWITAVVTTRAKALTSATPGDYVPGSARARVFLITMRRHFTAKDISRPPRAPAPTGRCLSLVIDAKTFRGLDFGIGPKTAAGPARRPRTGHLSHWPQPLTEAPGHDAPWPARHTCCTRSALGTVTTFHRSCAALRVGLGANDFATPWV